MATYGLPNNNKILAALGMIALRHGHLDNALRMVIKDLAGVTKQEALDATARQMSGELRGRIRKLAKHRIGEGPALVRLHALLERAERATNRRNEFFHRTWGIEKASEAGARRVVVRDDCHAFQRAPTLKELMAAVEELEGILDDLLRAQRRGFLSKAIKKKNC